VVIHVLVIELKVVVLQVATGEKVICALGAAAESSDPLSTAVTVEFVNVIVAPVLGMPFAVKLAFNQIHSPELMGVPLKPDEMLACPEQGGGDGGPQVRLIGDTAIAFNPPFVPGIQAVPEKL
jgi:hypothetical protein